MSTADDGPVDGGSAVCVFCGSSSGFEPVYAETAAALGTAIAGRGRRLVYGGGRVGLMGVVADAALAAGGAVTGVMTTQLVDAEVAHTGLTTLEVEPTMHARKARMIALSDGAIVLPGGFGTWEEAVELVTWNQLGLVSIPVVFLDLDGYYRPFFELIDGAVRRGFINTANAALARRATTVAEALDLATSTPDPVTPKWIR